MENDNLMGARNVEMTKQTNSRCYNTTDYNLGNYEEIIPRHVLRMRLIFWEKAHLIKAVGVKKFRDTPLTRFGIYR